MATLYDGNGNEITISGGGSTGTTATYQPYNRLETIGDSLTFGSYPNSVARILQIPNVTNHAVNGAHLVGTGENDMIAQASRVSSACDICCIMGGTNDITVVESNQIGEIGTKDSTTFLGSYQTIIESLLSKNPKMRIILLKPPRRYNKDVAYLKTIGECIDKLHEYYGVPVIDVFNDLGMNEFNYEAFLSDKLHFNSDGVNMLSVFIAHQILTY